MSKGILYGVSVGPGDPELLTLKAVKALEASTVIFSPKTDGGSTVALDIARQGCDLSKKKIIQMAVPMLQGREASLAAYKAGGEAMIAHLAQGENVAVLNLGDISIYSTFSYIQPLVKERGFEIQVIPGVPSFCAAAAAFQVSLTHRERPLHIIPANYGDVKEHLAYAGTKVLMKAGKVLEEIKEELKGKEGVEYALLAENVGLPNERLKPLEDSDKRNSYFTTLLIKE